MKKNHRASLLCIAAFLTVVLLIYFGNKHEKKYKDFVQLLANTGSLEKISAKDGSKPNTSASSNAPILKRVSDLFIQDQFCQYLDYAKQLRATSQGFIDELTLRALFSPNVEQINPCLLALTTRTYASALAYTKASDEPSCDFVLALLLSGQMDGIPDTPKVTSADLERAEEILSNLQARYNWNGIYSFFLLPVQEQLHRPAIVMESSVHSFFAAENFDNPLVAEWSQIFSLGLRSKTRFAAAGELFMTSNSPSFAAPSKLLKRLAIDPRYSQEAQKWTERFSDYLRALNQRGTFEPEVSLIQIASFRYLASTLWKINHPEASTEIREPFAIAEDSWKTFYRQTVAASPFAILGGVATFREGVCNDAVAQKIEAKVKQYEQDWLARDRD